MLKKVFIVVSVCTCLCWQLRVLAQDSSNQSVRIAVLAPLYLDSAFDGTNYKLSNTSIPKYMINGLDFYNGVMMAVDSLNKEGLNIDLWIYDTRSKNKNQEAIAAEMAEMHVSLIIAAFSGAGEQKLFSEFAAKHHIPLVSATYPNDAYVNNNPNFVMVNSSLRTHVEALYKYIQRNYPIGKYLYVNRRGATEDKVAKMFNDEGKKTATLNYKSLQLSDDFTQDAILPLLDSNRQNVIICGSLDENFANNLIKTLDETTSYQLVLVGMPTFDGLKNLYKTANTQLEIVYSTPYHYDKANVVVDALTKNYKAKFYGRPGYMFFKGFESMFSFAHLYVKYHDAFLQHLNDNNFNIANKFQFQPVSLADNNASTDYLENKKLYFIHVYQGNIKAVF